MPKKEAETSIDIDGLAQILFRFLPDLLCPHFDSLPCRDLDLNLSTMSSSYVGIQLWAGTQER